MAASELNDYSWFVYALTLLLTLSICFIIILVIVKCAETCYETQLFCCKQKQQQPQQQQQQRRHHRQRRRTPNDQSAQANPGNSRSTQSLSNSANFDDNVSTSSSSSTSSLDESVTQPARQIQQTDSILSLDHSSIVLIPNLFYNNMAFDDSDEHHPQTVSVDTANRSKANRKWGVRDRFAQAYLKSTISTPISLQIDRNARLSVTSAQTNHISTVSGHVECFHPQSNSQTPTIIAIDLNKTKLKYCASQPVVPCLGLSNAGFLVNRGFLIAGEPASDEAGLNSSKMDASLETTGDAANSSLRLEDEIPPSYEQIVKESIV
jgi:hypothetical protein